MKLVDVIVRVAAAGGVGMAGAAAARPEIGPGAFTAGATVINFDNLAGAPNLSTGEILANQYAAQGVAFTNTWGNSRANTSLANLFATNTDPNVIWADQGGGGAVGTTQYQRIAFTVPVNRVGMFFGTSAASTVTLRVFGQGGVLLEELTKTGQPLGAFGLEGFIGLERPELIVEARVNSTSNSPTQGPFNFEFDDLRFEAAGTPCYPDCNGVGGLTIADFGCFQTRFVAGDPYADCNGVGGLTIADFACFQTAFVAGCP